MWHADVKNMKHVNIMGIQEYGVAKIKFPLNKDK